MSVSAFENRSMVRVFERLFEETWAPFWSLDLVVSLKLSSCSWLKLGKGESRGYLRKQYLEGFILLVHFYLFLMNSIKYLHLTM